jgi:ABC-type transport system involved in multi-copper enzyme maturation permease subunit
MPKPRLADWLPWRWRVFGPILPYDLVTSSRRGRWYVLRFLLTGVMFVVFWQASSRFEDAMHWSSRENAKSQFAEAFYVSFASIHLTAALLLAAAFLGGAIADERRRRILDFMFATDLTSREIILGKFASRAFMIAALLAGSLPILACTMLFGGVSIDWIVQLAVLTLSTLLCFGGLSVLVSTTIARPRDAVVRAMALTAFLVIVPSILEEVARELVDYPFAEWVGAAMGGLERLNPYVVLYRQTVMSSSAAEFVWDYTLQTALAQSGTGVLALLWAVLAVRRTITRSPSQTVSKKPLLRRRRFLTPSLGNWPPIFWREAFGEPAVKVRGPVGRVVATLIYLTINGGIVGTWLYAVSESGNSKEAAFIAMAVAAVMVTFFGLLLVGTRAAASVTSEREADTWTTLLAGPIESSAIVNGKVFGSIVGFRHLVVPFALCWLLAGVFAPWEAAFRGVSMLAVGLLLAYVNANIGFLFSMRSKSTSAAVVKTVITLLTLVGGYMIPLSLLIRGPDDGVYAMSQGFMIGFPAFSELHRSAPHDGWKEFVAGGAFYLILAVTMAAVNHAIFDAHTGRTSPRTPPTTPPPKAPRAMPAISADHPPVTRPDVEAAS